jgi:SRSO17 transposase
MKNQSPTLQTRAERFENYLTLLSQQMDHADRVQPLRDYLTGLLLSLPRKSIEPLAAKVAPAAVCAKHQSLHHFIARAAWSDAAVWRVIRQYTLPAILQWGRIESAIFDDTGFPKRGTHSVGVARQYCGQLGKTDNCQVAVSLTLAHQWAALPVAFELYLPEDWCADPKRRQRTGVPASLSFRTKPQIALAQLDWAQREGLPLGIINADAAYGNQTAFREGLTVRHVRYAVGIQATTTVWPAGQSPLPPQVRSPMGPPPKLLRRDATHQPLTVKQLAEQAGREAFRLSTWREGAKGQLSSFFYRTRVRPAHRDFERTTPRDEEWLLIEWPQSEPEPTKYWLSTLPSPTSLRQLVAAAKGRWPVERDYEELKDLGLGDYEVRGWRGFHHHATLCVAAYAFLIAERGLFPPRRSDRTPRRTRARISTGQRR